LDWRPEAMSEVIPTKEVEEKEEVVIRFCGDSGDGMQIAGTRFTQASAVFGNDISSFPDYPAEIRAPAGSLPGVSGYQIQFSSRDIKTPGDTPDVLVAMNPAALKANIKDLKEGGILIVNEDTFVEENLKLAGYTMNPLHDESLSKFLLYPLPMTKLTGKALEGSPLTRKEVERCKNFFALGVMFWLYHRPMDQTISWITNQFKTKPNLGTANILALKSGYNFGETTDIFRKTYRVPKARLPQGEYRHITGNEATALGFITAATLAQKELVYASYPITPASEILHELSKHKEFKVKTLQAEDEIAAAGMALGASFTGAIALTGTSGPGLSLKGETLGLGVMMELPFVIVDVQRGGPSTGLPTKTEQADLFLAIYGRHGECPMPVIAPATPADCFDMAIEAVRLATTYMTPILYLSDAYLANGADPWKIPDISTLPQIKTHHPVGPSGLEPYSRDPITLARPWILPGTKGMEHRLGGLEKQDGIGNVSYDPLNHEAMVKIRAAKVEGISRDIPQLKIEGDPQSKVLIVGWGSTYGAITTAVQQLNKQNTKIAQIHLRYLNPFPSNFKEILDQFETIIIAEMNLGQLAQIIQGKWAIAVHKINKVQGQPFKVKEIVRGIKEILKGDQQWEKKPKRVAS